jgi:septal ring factor EnvC (AmiA/AmiB activator)
MRRAGAFGLLLLGAIVSVAAQQAVDREARQRAIQANIVRLQEELQALRSREAGLLNELERLRTELALREAESEEVTLQIEAVDEAIAERTAGLEVLEAEQERRRHYLAFRLREIYKQGPQQTLRRVVGGAELESYLDGMRYAAFLSERDSRVLAAYRADSERLVRERRELETRNGELRRLEQDLDRSRLEIGRTRRRRSELLAEVREDADKRRVALSELESAARDLDRLADSFLPGGDPPQMDVRKFRGLLDWPAPGKVTAGFGTVVHPRFKTEVPHPGLDIDAETGSDIRSVFDGRVVFASWMRGYGLTAIVDHGGGLLSVYAHASAILVEPGEQVVQGQRLGLVGETGSLRGAFLYFELRESGSPVDPTDWLRPR